MLEIKGKYCKDCKIFAETIEEEALSTVYGICDHPHTKTRIICKDQSTSAVSLSLDEIMENKNKAFKRLMKCEKEELIRYLLNDGMF